MLLAVFTLAPLTLGLFLLAFGVPDRPFLAPSPRNLVAVAIAAVLLGPVAQIALGVAGWLVLLGSLVTGVLLLVGIGTPRRRSVPE